MSRRDKWVVASVKHKVVSMCVAAGVERKAASRVVANAEHKAASIGALRVSLLKIGR
jgi:hypothetical protein